MYQFKCRAYPVLIAVMTALVANGPAVRAFRIT
jgi:hypothetical protein